MKFMYYNLLVLIVLQLAVCQSFILAEEGPVLEENFQTTNESIPVFNPPENVSKKRRRDAGITYNNFNMYNNQQQKLSVKIGNASSIVRSGIRAGIRSIVRAGTRSSTRGMTRAGTRGMTRAGTRGMTRAGTRGMTRAGTRGMTRADTRGMTRAGTRGMTRAGTRGMTRAGTRGMTRAGTRGMTRAGTRGMTRAGTHEEIKNPNTLELKDTKQLGTLKQYPSHIEPLATKCTGFTSRKSPVLSWYISEPCAREVWFTLNEIKSMTPILKTSFPPPESAGIYSIDLSEYNVILEPGQEYEWFVYIILDKKERSSDFLASATIKYIKPQDNLKSSLQQRRPDRHYLLYASFGFWYDSIEEISHLIDKNPENKLLISHRAKLLKQAELPNAYAYENN
jgi:hypothetical protein